MNRLTNKKSTEEIRSYRILFETYKGKVYRVAYYILKNEQDSKDIVQEAFTIAYKKMDTLRDLSKFESWICTIGANLAKDKCKKNGKEILTDDYDKVMPMVSVIEPIELQEEILEKQELKENVLEQINHLNSHYREVIILYYYVELSYEEIATTLNISQGTVKSRLFRAKKMLKSEMIKAEKGQPVTI
ncbi:RNA polymerase, sigma-24 subunit, ECF subfamily [Alkaliphilus metalliredigens QYMF]|uniref:RNA polymerase, sigma-24 subunit, ECF subfamily n=1 Tax=Alkaliphilus metalliredigens (strain QYMF) TaxID=293826 RepID=A6TP50_ALKMQ|nr:RNA polymerase sigma factor [Alkaliphilus metalliredigens]ABR47968.1 RNA polymerase, sigma-24 subunit, ECF subfamily [Alkaliphilus metalliredigens QYMF]